MARGDKNKATQASLNMAGQASGLAGQQAGAADAAAKSSAALESSIVPSYQQIVNHPGYSPQDKAAIGTAEQEATGSAFGSAKDALARRAAKTRNTAGLGESEDALARDKAKVMGEQAAGLQKGFADTAFNQKMAALGGEAGLYGIDQNTLRTMMGLPAEDIRAGASALGPGAELAGKPGFWGELGGAFANTLGKGLGGRILGIG